MNVGSQFGSRDQGEFGIRDLGSRVACRLALVPQRAAEARHDQAALSLCLTEEFEGFWGLGEGPGVRIQVNYNCKLPGSSGDGGVK